jgi:small conductance mechanosensitive channel
MHRSFPYLLSLILLVFLALPAAAQAPASPAAAIAPDDVARAIGLLQDDAARADLIAKLQLLADAGKQVDPGPAPETPVGLVATMLASLTDTVGTISRTLTGAAVAIADMPNLVGWAERQFRDPSLLERWITMAWNLALVLGAGYLAERVIVRLAAPLRTRVETAGRPGWLVRGGLLILRALLDVVAIGIFVAAAYLTLSLLNPGRVTQLVAVTLINANLLVRVLMALGRLLLAPRVPNLRLLRIGDETAAYLYVWLRRLADVTIYGYFGLEAARLLGLGPDLHALLLRLLGLMVVTMVVILVLQAREPTNLWIRRRFAGSSVMPGAVSSLGRRFADVWHIAVIVYLAAAYLVWAAGIEGGFEYLLRVTLLTALVVAVARLAILGITRGIERGFTVGRELGERLPGLQTRANLYLPLLHMVLRGAILVIATVVLMQIWGIGSFRWLASPVGRRLVATLLTIGMVLAIAALVWEVVSSLIERYLTESDARGNPLPRSARVRTLLPLLRNAVMVLLIVVVSLIVLAELGVNIAPLLAGAGVVGLAIGFGAQTLVRDVITGLFILFEDSIRVGDVVEVAGKSGAVEAITIRAIRLRDGRGNVISVPFSSVSLVMNMTKDFSFYMMDIALDFGSDVADARRILTEIDAELRADPAFASSILSPLEVLGVERFEGAQLILRARVKTIPGKQWSVGREFNLRIQSRLIGAGIWSPPAPTAAAELVPARA